MGLLTDLFSKESIMKTASRAAVNGVDMAFFTEEERQIASQKILDWKLEYQKATSPQNMSRRFIAVTVTLLWSVLLLLSVFLSVFGLQEQGDHVFKVLMEVAMQPFTVILGFYFLAHMPIKFGKG